MGREDKSEEEGDKPETRQVGREDKSEEEGDKPETRQVVCVLDENMSRGEKGRWGGKHVRCSQV